MKINNIVYFIFDTKNNGGNGVIFEHVNRLKRKEYNGRIIILLSFNLKTSNPSKVLTLSN